MVFTAFIFLISLSYVLADFNLGDSNNKARLGNDIIGSGYKILNIGALSISTGTDAGYVLNIEGDSNIKGALYATNIFSDSLTGTISAANVSAGQFGSNTGGGNYTFPSALTVGSNLNVDSGTLYVDASNNRVGIGTISPGAKLEVTGRIKAQDPIDGNDLATKEYVDSSAPLGGIEGCAMEIASIGNNITIEPGYIEVGGKWYHWDASLTFTAGSSGSNSASDSLPSSNSFVYIYVDASTLPSSPSTPLTASNFISKSAIPSWSDSKHGYYDGDDRFIGAFRYDSSDSGFFKSKMLSDGWVWYYDAWGQEVFENIGPGAVEITNVPSYKVCREFKGVIRINNSNSSSDASVIVYHYNNGSSTGERDAKIEIKGYENGYQDIDLSFMYDNNYKYFSFDNVNNNGLWIKAYKIER